MNYAKINKNDIVNGEGVCVSLFVSGCPIHCDGCFNKEAWDFNYGQPFTQDTINEILHSLCTNGITRNFSILGGEPLAIQNLHEVAECVKIVKKFFPNIQIHLWSGYEWHNIIARISANNQDMIDIYNNVDFLILGPFIKEQKDLSLKWRGSKNQTIYNMKEIRH